MPTVNSSYSAVARDLMDLVIRQWQLELAWAQRLREQIVAAQALQNTGAQLNGGHAYA